MTEQNPITTFLAKTLSVLMHPLLMPTLTFVIIFYFCPIAVELPPHATTLILFTIFITTFLFPLISTFVLIYVIKKSFSLSDLVMEDHKERFYPFLFTGFFYAAITFMFFRDQYRPVIIAIMGGIALVTIITAIITYYRKISVHAVGICGVIGSLLVVSYYFPYDIMLYPLGIIILLAGFLMSARMSLGAHNPKQIFWGALLGIVVPILFYVVFQRFAFPFVNS